MSEGPVRSTLNLRNASEKVETNASLIHPTILRFPFFFFDRRNEERERDTHALDEETFRILDVEAGFDVLGCDVLEWIAHEIVVGLPGSFLRCDPGVVYEILMVGGGDVEEG